MQRLVRVLLSFAFAFGATLPAQAQTSGAISGDVHDAGSAPIVAATVTLSGTQSQKTTSDNAGHFTFNNLAPGTYAVSVTKGGFQPGGVGPITVASQPVNISVTLETATLSSIRVIAHAVASAQGRFNSSEAAQTYVSASRMQTSGQVIQVNHVLDQIPGVVSARSGGTNAAVPGSITSPNFRGALDYEKETLVDGHPLINGRFGDYPIMFVNSFLLDGIEITQGPAANASSINYGIGGTMNLRTAQPTAETMGDLLLGLDGYGGAYSNVRYSGSSVNGKLGFVLDYATYGTRGPLNSYASQVALPAGTTIDGYGTLTKSAGKAQNTSTTLVACCQQLNSSFLNRGALAKLRYAFSPATSATLSYYDLSSQYDNTASGFTQVFSAFTPGAGYSAAAGGPLPGSPVLLNSAAQIPNRGLIDNQPVLQAELRTTLHNDTILARIYGAALDRFTGNSVANPTANYTTGPFKLYGTATIGAATAVFNGQSANLTIPTPYFQQVEQDQLRGESFQYDHPIAGNLLTFSFDRTTFLTNAYQITGSASKPAGNVSVNIPGGTRQDFSTYLARGIWELGSKTEVTLSNYYNVYQSRFTPAKNPDGSFVFQTIARTHDDPRLGIAYHPSSDVSLRLALGSAVAPPYPQLLDTLSQTPAQVYTPGATTITIAQNSGGLAPETSFGYNLGGDWRLRDGAILSVDAYLTNLRNQFVGTVTPDGFYTPPGTTTQVPVYVSTNSNLGKARFEGIQATLSKDVPVGVGYVVSGALQRAYPYDIDPSFYATAAGPYTTNLGVVPGINFVGDNKPLFNGISNKSEAYAQGYAEIHRRWEHGQYFALGDTYYGPNNTYNVPAFFVMNAVYRMPVVAGTSLQISADNLLGAYSQPWVQYGGGIAAPLVNGGTGVRNQVPYGPTVLHVELEQRF